MTFWRTFGFHNVSSIDSLLDRESFTLEDLLDEEELLSECKGQNQKLLDYLLQPETLSHLMDYLTNDPPPDADMKVKQKYPYLACEILCLEVWDICEVIYDKPELLAKLWSFLEKAPPVNPFAVRVASVLMQRKIGESFGFLRSKESFVDKFLVHIGNSSVNELLMKLIGCDETPEGSGIIKWLSDQNLVGLLVEKFNPQYSADEHENVSQTLVDIIVSEGHGCQLLVEELQSKKIFQTLFQHITSSNTKSSINWGLQVVIEVVKREAGRPKDAPLPDFIEVCSEFLKPLSLIISSTPVDKINTSIGEVIPVGTHRLKVVEFFSVLLSQNFETFDNLLLDLGVFDACITMFFQNFWNNFLHALVGDMICTFVSTRNPDVALRLLTQCGVVDKICEAAAENEKSIGGPKGFSRGYTGFIDNISNKLVEASESDDTGTLSGYLKGHPAWKGYVDTTLKKHNADAMIVLGGQKPTPDDPQSSEEEDGRPGEPNSVFSPYQVKQGFTNDFPKDFLADEYDFDEEDPDDLSNILIDKAFDKLLGEDPYRTEDSDDEEDDSAN